MDKHIIDFEPVGRRGEFSSDDSLLDCARQLGVDLISICGGAGSCGQCKVQIIAGYLSPLTSAERTALSPAEQQDGFRLACMAFPRSDVTLHVPAESLSAPQRTQVEGLVVDVEPAPPVSRQELDLIQPTLTSPKSDVRLISEQLASCDLKVDQIDFRVLQQLSIRIRESDWRIQGIIRGSEIIAVVPPSTRCLGLAVDIGTTKIAGYLIDLETGNTLASRGIMNPQISYGEDVVSRIVVASKSPENASKLQSLLVEALNQIAADLCEEVGASPQELMEAVVVGNTAIHHLFLKLPVKQLGIAPYSPAVDGALDVKAREIGLKIAPGAYVHLLPNIAGYVGADHVAMLLATRLAERDGVSLAIDIGTNTEICLNNRGEMVSVSCASGPAFEGAHIKYGMRAAPGAIEHFRLDKGKLEIQTIADEPPAGICGSGLLDIVAQLRLNDIIDSGGRFSSHPLVHFREDIPEFILAERPDLDPIVISQKDIRELQLAKAAIRMGIKTLVKAGGLAENDIDRVIIAGAFGTFIDVRAAITIGMLPDLPLDRFEQVGNAAGTGARMALISTVEREKSQGIARRDGYIELARVPDFNRQYAEATYL